MQQEFCGRQFVHELEVFFVSRFNQFAVCVGLHYQAALQSYVIGCHEHIDIVADFAQDVAGNLHVNFEYCIEQAGEEFVVCGAIHEPIFEATKVLADMYKSAGEVEDECAI